MGILFIPEYVPAVHRIVHHFRVVKNAHRAPHIRNRVFIVRIKGQVHEPLVNVLYVWYVIHVELVEHVVRYELLNDVVRWKAQVVYAVGRFELHDHLLVVRHERIVDVYARLLLKALYELLIDIVAPVKDIKRDHIV